MEGRPDETMHGDAWLQKVTAAFEWKAQREVEMEERQRSAAGASSQTGELRGW
eukprot:Skav231253  [mRNA]  locus=scaffold411:594918:595850:- [translate_table: standard]